MNKLIIKILRMILNLQQARHSKKQAVLELEQSCLPSSLSFSNGSGKTYMNAHESITISSKFQDKRKQIDKKIREIVKRNIKTPDRLLEFIEKNGTKVYRVKFADKLLRFVGEEEGFILPHKGFEAFCLNLALENKISFKTSEMFILRDLPVNVYAMSHQFHKWYGFKMNLPGFDERATELFRDVCENNYQAPKNLKYSDIMSLKEALRRDIEAIDFVVNLSRENEKSHEALDNIKNGAKVKI